MLFKYRRLAQSRWFDWGVRSVSDTDPVRLDRHATAQAVTQIYPPDLMMYVIAIKTFARFVPLRNIWVVGDRLTSEHEDLLRRHVEGIRFINILDVDTNGFPRGGCWERLLHIADLSRDLYTLQVDADTITFRKPAEVTASIAANRCFTLGTSMGRQAIAAKDMPSQLQHIEGPYHIQVAAEMAFARLKDSSARYIRGNAAFAGFAPGAITRESLKRFSDEMAALLGPDRWREWGSEQVTSNFAIANTLDPLVLPFETYRYFAPGTDLSAVTFAHFIGSHRFSQGIYRRLARDAIRELKAAR
jgi:hypothetical protein